MASDPTPSNLVYIHPNGTPLDRLSMEMQIREVWNKDYWLRLYISSQFGLNSKYSFSLPSLILRHWVLDEMIRRGLITGNSMHIDVVNAESEIGLKNFKMNLFALVQNKEAVPPTDKEIDMSDNITWIAPPVVQGNAPFPTMPVIPTMPKMDPTANFTPPQVSFSPPSISNIPPPVSSPPPPVDYVPNVTPANAPEKLGPPPPIQGATETPDSVAEAPVVRKRGRPPKNAIPSAVTAPQQVQNTAPVLEPAGIPVAPMQAPVASLAQMSIPFEVPSAQIPANITDPVRDLQAAVANMSMVITILARGGLRGAGVNISNEGVDLVGLIKELGLTPFI